MINKTEYENIKQTTTNIEKKDEHNKETTDDSDNITKDSLISHPLLGAAAVGFGGAAAVTIGAAIQGHDIHDEALTILAGGAITGALAGLVSCCVPKTPRKSSLYLQFTLGLINTTLVLTASLTAPLMGEACLNLDTQWGETITDELIGSTTAVASGLGVITAGCVGALAIGYLAKGTQSISQKFFSTSTEAVRPNQETFTNSSTPTNTIQL